MEKCDKDCTCPLCTANSHPLLFVILLTIVFGVVIYLIAPVTF